MWSELQGNINTLILYIYFLKMSKSGHNNKNKYCLYRVFEEILNSSHMTRATIPREGDDREDRRGAVQTGGDGR